MQARLVTTYQPRTNVDFFQRPSDESPSSYLGFVIDRNCLVGDSHLQQVLANHSSSFSGYRVSESADRLLIELAEACDPQTQEGFIIKFNCSHAQLRKKIRFDTLHEVIRLQMQISTDTTRRVSFVNPDDDTSTNHPAF